MSYFGEISFSVKIRGSAVGTMTGYGLDDRGVGVGVGVPAVSRIFTSPRRPYGL
jgi:hypothetical protein